MISRQIGWSQESNLLYEIGKQMDILAKVLANSGKGSLEIYPNLSSFPPTGVPSVIYLAEDTGYIYYWDGASYIQFGGGSYVPTSRQLTINGVTFDLSADRTWTINTGDDIIVVANYSALPAPNTVSGQFYWCSNAQGTAWLPGSVGGTYYNSGLYYSNGTTWEFLNVPYQATQSEVNAGIISDKFVTPNTLFNSTQWATKQGALTLTTTGTSGAATLVGNTLNIPQYSGGGGMAIGGSITSATAGSVLFAGTSGVLAQNNANFFWDNTNTRLGIGTSSPVSRFEVVAGSDANGIKLRGRSADNISNFFFSSNDGVSQYGYLQHRSNEMRIVNNVGDLVFYTGPSVGFTEPVGRWFSTGNLVIQTSGTLSDAGFKVDINGTARIQGNLTTNLTLGSVPFIGTSGVLAQDNSNLFWDNTNKRLGIGTNAPTAQLNVNQVAGTTKGIFISGDEIYATGNGSFTKGIRIALGVSRTANRQLWLGDADAFGSSTLSIFRYQTGTTGYAGLDAVSGDGINRLLTLIGTDTSNVGIGLNNALSVNTTLYTGKLNIFTVDSTSNLLIQKFGTATGNYLDIKNTSGTSVALFTNNANLLLGTTTDAGFRLDVSGTSRHNGQTTLTGSVTASAALAQGVIANPTLVAAANNDVLVGLDVNPTFTNGAFSPVSNVSLRVTGETRINGRTKIGTGTFTLTSNFASMYIVADSTNTAQILTDKTQVYGLTYQINGTVFNIFSDYYSGSTTPTLGFGTFSNKNMIYLNTTGNVGINTTTDAGFRLDVNGTARVQGALTVGSNALYVNTTNLRIGNRTSSPGAGLDLWNNGITENAQLRISDSRVSIPDYSATGFDPVLSTNTLGFFAPFSSSTGGLQFGGFTSNTNTGTPLAFIGYQGGTSPTSAAIRFIGYKHNGTTNRTALTGNEIIAGFSSGFAADVFQVKANGRINMSSLPTSSAGLSAGDIWNDAGTLKIV